MAADAELAHTTLGNEQTAKAYVIAVLHEVGYYFRTDFLAMFT